MKPMMQLLTLLVACTTTALSSSDDSIRFLALGDWGKAASEAKSSKQSPVDDDDPILMRWLKENKQINQLAVARAMSLYSNMSEARPDFVLALGDNFYSSGVSSAFDLQWSSRFRDVYMSYGTSLRVPWHGVFGNHDYGYGRTGLIAQVLRSSATDDDEWQMDGFNYSRWYRTKQGISVLVVFIDSTSLAPSENKVTNEYGGVSKEVQAQLIADQLSHIELALLSARSAVEEPNWLIVAGHYPVFSVGSHGDTDELIKTLLPLLEKYRVDAYFSGHDHLSAHLRHNSVNFFVAGAGSMTDVEASISTANETLWIGAGFSAFAAIKATKNMLTVSFIDTNSSVVYKYDSVKISENDCCINSTITPSPEPSSGPTAKPSWVATDLPTSQPSSRPSQVAQVRESFIQHWMLTIGAGAASMLLLSLFLVVGFKFFLRRETLKMKEDNPDIEALNDFVKSDLSAHEQPRPQNYSVLRAGRKGYVAAPCSSSEASCHGIANSHDTQAIEV